MREIHHRVKNNLQIISSLINLQSDQVKDQQAFKVLQNSQHRVRSMALIHERLYQSPDLAQIDLAKYIRDVAAYLFRAYGACARGISLTIEADDVFLGIDAAVPCGLILNELVTNALKHAFPPGEDTSDDRKNEIRIELHATTDDRLTLVVADNGAGWPRDLDFRCTPTSRIIHQPFRRPRATEGFCPAEVAARHRSSARGGKTRAV